MARRSHLKPSTDTSRIGESVRHTTPGMLYHQTGTIVACYGIAYGETYWTVEYTHPTTHKVYQTPFASFVLVSA